jgi:tetratricopeptide (TPR) repeat protein
MNIDKAVEDEIQSVAKLQTADFDLQTAQSPQALLSAVSLRQKKELEIKADLRNFVDAIAAGLQEFSAIQAKGTALDPPISEEIDKLCRDVSHFQILALHALVETEETSLIKAKVGFSQKALLALYEQASQVYNEGRYKEAALLFLIITLLDPTLHDGWIALGNAEFFQERFQPALMAYAMAARVDPGNPTSHLLAAQAYEALKEFDQALHSLEIALFVIRENPDYKSLEVKAQEHIAHIQKLRQV